MNTYNRKFYSNIDWILIFLYFALSIGGILCIFSALYEGSDVALPSRFISQITWFGISIAVGIIILLIDSKYLFIYSYGIYFLLLAIMLLVAFVGKENKGARSWIQIGGFTLQPVEFMKIATSLALARYMSSYSFDMSRPRDFITMCSIIAAPVVTILIQNDTGSGTVFGAFLLMLYREGLNKWIYIIGISAICIFLAFFLVDPFLLFSVIIIFTTFFDGIIYGDLIHKLRYIIILYTIYLILFLFFARENGGTEPYILLIISFAITIPLIIYYISYKGGFKVLIHTIYVTGSILFYFCVDYVFNNIMQLHQRKRVLDLLGVENDLFGWGYNANQSKIAIGSGGWFGKGFLNGTQTKFNFVPEQSTDFIFCTVGEEFGFIGSLVVILLLTTLIFRLMRIGDKLSDSYSRIYCYCVASIFLFHMVVNIGMAIGIMPVIGIPLPFFSYGGSSFLAFTILLSIALKLNMDNFEKK